MIEQQQLISEQTQMLETIVPGNWPDPKRVLQLSMKKDSEKNTTDEKKSITILVSLVSPSPLLFLFSYIFPGFTVAI